MSVGTGDLHVNKYVLVWPMSVPNEVHALFTMVFMDVFGLIKYVSKVLTKTDTFHLIIPLNCLEDLRQDPVYRFPQVVHIDVICDSINDLTRIEPSFRYGFGELQFWVIDDLLKLWAKAKVDRRLILTDSFDTDIRNAIVKLRKDYISAKQADLSRRRRSHIQNQFVSTSLHGFPLTNATDFPLHGICPSCKLGYRQRYELACRHHLCQICVNTRTSCAMCSKTVTRDQSLLNSNLQMEIQDFCVRCSYCDWKRPLKEYEVHLKQNHPEKLTCFVRNRQVEESDKIESPNGTCIWEVSDIDKIKNDATTGMQFSVYSEPFYLYPNGYKMCLRLYLNGDAKAKGTHMSLFFALMRGEKDKQLQWPFEFKVTFSLIDQSITTDDQQHISQFCEPDITTKSLACPDTDMNIAFGIPMFVPLATLEENRNRYITNDTMFIKIEIDLLAPKPTSPLVDGKGELPNDEEHVDTTTVDIDAMIHSSDHSNGIQQPK